MTKISYKENKFYEVVFIFLISSYVLGYSKDFSSLGIAMKYILTAIMCTFFFKNKVNFKKYIPIISLVFPFFIIPLFLISIGVYTIRVTNVLYNCFFYLIYILLTISIIEEFDYMDDFFMDVQKGIVLPFLLIIIKDGKFTLNIFYLIKNMFTNTRDQRLFMGFSNPNMTGLLAMLGLVSSILLLIKKRNPRLNLFLVFVYILIIANTGSRTALMSPLIGLSIIVFIYILSKISSYKKIVLVSLFLFVGLIFFFILLNFSKMTVDLGSINKITTGRFFRQLSTFNFLKQNNLLLFGIGNLNNSALYSGGSIMNNSLNTDNSPMYLLLTIGIVGVIQVFIIIIMLFFKIKFENLIGIFLLTTWLISGIFEHTVFVPSSLISLFFLCSFYLSDKENKKRETTEESNFVIKI